MYGVWDKPHGNWSSHHYVSWTVVASKSTWEWFITNGRGALGGKRTQRFFNSAASELQRATKSLNPPFFPNQERDIFPHDDKRFIGATYLHALGYYLNTLKETQRGQTPQNRIVLNLCAYAPFYYPVQYLYLIIPHTSRSGLAKRCSTPQSIGVSHIICTSIALCNTGIFKITKWFYYWLFHAGI